MSYGGPSVSFRIRERVLNRLLEVARARGIEPSEFARRALGKALLESPDVPTKCQCEVYATGHRGPQDPRFYE